MTLTFVDSFNAKYFVLILMHTGVIADIFDGIIARKLNISTTSFRVLDTIFDLLFYLSILVYIASTNSHAISNNTLLIVIIISLEGLMYIVSFIRFKKAPSPHAILSKFWGLYIIIEFTLLIMGVAGNHFTIALCFGVIIHTERVLIYSILKQWDHDIPTVYHALQLKQGKQIVRRKIFNG